MYIKKAAVLICAVAAAVCMTACQKKEVVIPEEAVEALKNPDLTLKDDIEIDWIQVRNDFEDIMLSSDYPEVDFVDFAVFEDSNTTQVTIGLKQGTSQYPDSLRIAEEAIRYLNDIIRTQDFSIAESADDYYGGYWDERDMELQVYQVQDMFDPGNYYVFQLIEHGSNGPVAPQIMDRVKESLAELSESAQSDK